MNTKNIKFTLGSGGKYQSTDASKITIGDFEISATYGDRDVEIQDVNLETLAGFVCYEELVNLDQYDMEALVKVLLDKHGHESILEELLRYDPKEELIDALNRLDP